MAVLAADPDDDFIMMPVKLPCRCLPCFLCDSIMVRKCYRGIFNLMLEIDQQAAGTCESGFGMVITGTLGIGESTLALYLICCLANRQQRVVYRCVRAVACTAGSCADSCGKCRAPLEDIPWACAKSVHTARGCSPGLICMR